MNNEKIDKKQADKYMELQTFKKQLDEFNSRKEQIVQTILQITNTTDTLENIDKMDKDILFSVGSNVFLQGSITDSSKALVNVGSNIYSLKPLEEAKRVMKDRMEMLSNGYNEVNGVINKIQSHMMTLEKELNQEG